MRVPRASLCFLSTASTLVFLSVAGRAQSPCFEGNLYPISTGHEPGFTASGDLDGDGDADLVVANSDEGNLSVLLNDGSGGFPTHVEYYTGGYPSCLALADLDGDGDLDLAVSNQGNQALVRLNNGDGTFGPWLMYGTGQGLNWIAIGDLDGDGDADLCTANSFAVSSRLPASMMRQARPDDVFSFASVAEIRSLWPGVQRYLGRSRAFWSWLLQTWEAQGRVPR